MHVTIFGHKGDNVGEPHDLPWPELCNLFHTHTIRPDKDGPALTACHFSGTRSKAAAGPSQLACIDFDCQTPEDVGRIEAMVDAAGFAHILYTTHSHMQSCDKCHREQCIRFRLILPLSRPVDAAAWPSFYPNVQAIFGRADPSTKDISRLFFLPSCPPWMSNAAYSRVQIEGNCLDVSVVQARPVGPPPPRPGFGGVVTREVVEQVGKALSRKADPYMVVMGRAIVQMCKGEPYAEQGERDNTTWAMACILAEQFPDADPGRLGNYFGPSLAVMTGTHVTVENVIEKVSRHQEEVRAANARPQDDRSLRIAHVYANGRNWGYTAEEVASWGDMANRWVLSSGDGFYLFFDGTYVGPFKGKYAEYAVLDYLSPATHIPTMRLTKEGPVLASMRELLPVFGETMAGLEGSFLETRTRYDRDRKVLIQALAPMRVIEPREHAAVARWLALLGGEPLLDWLAVLPRLERAAPALFLCGASGVGKSLLACGLAALWGRGSGVPMTEAMGSFSAAITQCPLVVAEEALPKTFKGHARTEELRDLISRTEHTVTQKYRDNMTVRGALRIMLLANSQEAIWGHFSPNSEDIKALSERIIYCEPSREAEALLLDMPYSERVAWATHRIAEHTMWLAATRTVRSDGRFACLGRMGTMLDELQVGGGLRWQIFAWVHSFLQAPTACLSSVRQLRTQAPVTVWQGQVLVRAKEMHQYWKFHSQEDQPSRVEIKRVLKHIAPDHMRTGRDLDKVRWSRLDMSLMLAWLSSEGENDLNLQEYERLIRMAGN